jgi:hypothetical protein
VLFIGDNAFAYCASLAQVTLNEGLEFIGSNAFDNTAIQELTIPSTVRDMYDVYFTNCMNLERVIFRGDAPTVQSTQGWYESSRSEELYYPMYTVYYPITAQGFTRPTWHVFACELMLYATEQFVLDHLGDYHYSEIPIYHVELWNSLGVSGLDEVTVLDSYSEYEAFAHVLTSARYDREYFEEFAIVLIHVQQCSSEQVLGLAGIGAQLYNTGGVSYFGLYPVVKFDCGQGDMTTDIFSTYVLAEVKRSDIRTDNIRRTGSIYAYDIHTQSASAYHPGLVDKGK